MSLYSMPMRPRLTSREPLWPVRTCLEGAPVSFNALKLLLMAMRDRGQQPTIDDLIHVLDWADGRDGVDTYDIEAQMELAVRRRLASCKMEAQLPSRS